MNRNFKFRAWIAADELMSYTESVQIGSPAHEAICIEIGMVYPVGEKQTEGIKRPPKIVLMQYTGLKDKNGVKIYEGDYVICPQRDEDQGVVEFSHTGQYVLAQGSFKVSLYDLVYNKWPLEVIGNIYETPELLERNEE